MTRNRHLERGHSRHSFPFDKPLPYAVARCYAGRNGRGSGRGVVKRLHTRKQRQHNRSLARGATDGS